MDEQYKKLNKKKSELAGRITEVIRDTNRITNSNKAPITRDIIKTVMKAMKDIQPLSIGETKLVEKVDYLESSIEQNYAFYSKLLKKYNTANRDLNIATKFIEQKRNSALKIELENRNYLSKNIIYSLKILSPFILIALYELNREKLTDFINSQIETTSEQIKSIFDITTDMYDYFFEFHEETLPITTQPHLTEELLTAGDNQDAITT